MKSANGIKKRLLIISVISITLCLIAGGVYLFLTEYFGNRFLPNTWIGGIYCTGKSVEEVNSELLEVAKAPSIVITDRQGREWTLNTEEVGYTRDYTRALQMRLDMQDPSLWMNSIKSEDTYEPEAAITYDETKLRAFWENLDCVKEEAEIPAEVTIIQTQSGYTLENHTLQRLNAEKGYALLKQALEPEHTSTQNGQTFISGMDTECAPVITINLEEAGVYEDIPLTKAQEQTLVQWEKVEAFLDRKLSFDMGAETITLDGSITWEFLIREADGTFRQNEDGSLTISREMTDQFIDGLADEYDTYGKERTFLSTRGDEITLTKGSYGTLLNRDAEKEYLYHAILNGIEEIHVPSYEREAYHRGKNDIGDTYIEIDMTMQKMYFYQNGECLVDTDIVTGNLSRRWGTPAGIYYVYSMQKNRILRGPGYASPVKFWMPVNGNIGIHDAGWRKTFGGEIYKTNGSHGCINTPYEKMKQIYELSEIGTPVVMFY